MQPPFLRLEGRWGWSQTPRGGHWNCTMAGWAHTDTTRFTEVKIFRAGLMIVARKKEEENTLTKCLQPKRCNTMKSGSVVENENNKLLDTVAVGSYVLVGRPTGHWRKVKIGAYCWDKSFVVIYGERHQVNTFGAVWLFSPFLCHWPPPESDWPSLNSDRIFLFLELEISVGSSSL